MCLLTTIVLTPIRAADAPASTPRLVIQTAIYGDFDNDKTIDVTQKVARMVKNENFWVIPSFQIFGNPAPNVTKTLKVGYTIDGIYHKKTAADGEPLDISARLMIRKAVYGELSKGPSVDVTEDVAGLVQKNSLMLKVSNDFFGDPAAGVMKKLRVDYTFDGKEKSKTVGENDTLTISNKGE